MTPHRFLKIATCLTLGLAALLVLPGCFFQVNQPPAASDGTSTTTDPNIADAAHSDPNATLSVKKSMTLY